MAERRMMSKKIVDSDLFMSMPSSTQALYFHLLLRADDEGFVGNTRNIMRLANSNDDDYKILLAKSFIIEFSSGICVIKHWYVHNYIQKDRFSDSRYTDEKNILRIKKDRVYVGVNEECTQTVYKLDTQYRKEKKSLEKKKVSKAEKLIAGYEESFETFWESYPEKIGKGKAYEVWQLLTSEIKVKCIDAINNQVSKKHFFKDWLNKDSIPHPTTWLNQKRWEDVVSELKARRGSNALVDEHTQNIINSLERKTIDLNKTCN